MTLLELLTAMTSVAFFASSIATARYANPGIGGYTLATIIGLSLAISNAWMFYKLGGILANLTSTYSETKQEWCGRAFYLFALLWLVVGTILTSLATSAAIQRLS